MSHKRLLYNLHKRHIDEKTLRWIANILKNRRIRIKVDGFLSEPYRTETGIPQGANLSPILYIFYNADLIEACNNKESILAGFIDNTAILI